MFLKSKIYRFLGKRSNSTTWFTDEELHKIVLPEITVNQASILLYPPKNIMLRGLNGAYPFDCRNENHRKWYGNYVVSYIKACRKGRYEIGIKMMPVEKEETQTE